MRAHEARLGNLPAAATGRPLFGRVRGRLALDDGIMELVRRRGAPTGRWETLRSSERALRLRRRSLWEAGTCTVAAREAYEHMPDLSALDDDALLALRRRLVDLAVRTMCAEVAVASAAVASQQRLETQLRRHLEDAQARMWALRVTSRPGSTVAGWPARELRSTFESAPTEALEVLAEAGDPTEAASAAEAVSGAAALYRRAETLIRRAGSMAVLAGPTWDEDPSRWWAAVSRTAEDELRARSDGDTSREPDGPAPTALDEMLERLAANPEWRQYRIRTAQVVDLRRLLLRRQAEDAADLLERRERTKAAVLAIGGLVRRVHLEAGARLVEAGLLEERTDVELLDEGELRSALGAEGTEVPPPAELAHRRHRLAAFEQAGPLPERFEGSLPTQHPESAAGELLSGWAAAPGRHRGRARVLADSGRGELARGDVLVATSTDASWAPLFMVAGAVVVERGGPLSHAAIVARELGIPAVVNVPGVVARLSKGDHEVVVDGTAGTVELEDT